MVKKLKDIFTGISVYLFPYIVPSLISKWYFDEKEDDKQKFLKDIEYLRKRFWKYFRIILFIILVSIFITYFGGSFKFTLQNILRLCAIILAMTGTFSKLPFQECTFGGETLYDKIDKGMFIVSQVSSTLFLIIALYY